MGHAASSRAGAPDDIPRVRLGGLDVARVSREELARIMVRECLAARGEGRPGLPKLVFSCNGEGVALAARDEAFRRVMEEADIIHADGMSAVLASKLTPAPLPDRIATTDFFHDAARAAIEADLAFFILGGTEKANAATCASIRRLYPGLRIAGRAHGYHPPSEDARICALIRESGADVVWVGLGKPRQEQWCARNRERLRGVGWLKTCGGLYAFLTGDVPRAPGWMRRAGLEWLYRTWKEPRRLGLRYLTTNPIAFYLFLTRSTRR